MSVDKKEHVYVLLVNNWYTTSGFTFAKEGNPLTYGRKSIFANEIFTSEALILRNRLFPKRHF